MISALAAGLAIALVGIGPAGVAHSAAESAAGLAPATTAESAAADSTECVVSDATITWGFKESFRSYVSGSIANGEWTVADGATYATPNYGFSAGAGALSAGSGTISFSGSIEFTGHGGILDTTVSAPRLRFDGSNTATLLLDVSGTTQQGDPVDAAAVEFATVDVTAAAGPDRFALAAGAVTLTAAGAAAFGTYEAGTPLDPLALEFTAPSTCTVAPPATGIVAIAVGVAAAIAVALVAVLLVRRRRSLASASAASDTAEAAARP